MNVVTTFIGATIALVAVAFKVAAVGVVVTAHDTVVAAGISDPAAVHTAVDVADAPIASRRHFDIGAKVCTNRKTGACSGVGARPCAPSVLNAYP